MIRTNKLRLMGWCAALGLMFLYGRQATAQATLGGCVPCGQGCQKTHCPPRFHHCTEGPPRLKFRHGCARPICDPCDMPHFGYFQPCWRPWPFPPNWSHCPYPTPAAQVLPGEHVIGAQPYLNAVPQTTPNQTPIQLPQPRVYPPTPGF